MDRDTLNSSMKLYMTVAQHFQTATTCSCRQLSGSAPVAAADSLSSSMGGHAPEPGVRQLNMKAFKSPEYAQEVR